MESLIQAIQESYPEEIKVAFVSEVPRETQTGDTRYEAIWVFTNQYIGEIKNPLGSAGSQSSYDIALLTHRVDWVRLTRKEYDLQKATSDSRLAIEFSTSDGVTGTISSVGQGCDDLMKVYMEQFKPNFIEDQQ